MRLRRCCYENMRLQTELRALYDGMGSAVLRVGYVQGLLYAECPNPTSILSVCCSPCKAWVLAVPLHSAVMPDSVLHLFSLLLALF